MTYKELKERLGMANPLQNVTAGQMVRQWGGTAATSNTGSGITGIGGLSQSQWPAQPYYIPSPLPSCDEVDTLLRKFETDQYTVADVKYVVRLITTISQERGRLLLENDTLKESLKRAQDFKSWFADGKEPNDPSK